MSHPENIGSINSSGWNNYFNASVRNSPTSASNLIGDAGSPQENIKHFSNIRRIERAVLVQIPFDQLVGTRRRAYTETDVPNPKQINEIDLAIFIHISQGIGENWEPVRNNSNQAGIVSQLLRRN